MVSSKGKRKKTKKEESSSSESSSSSSSESEDSSEESSSSESDSSSEDKKSKKRKGRKSPKAKKKDKKKDSKKKSEKKRKTPKKKAKSKNQKTEKKGTKRPKTDPKKPKRAISAYNYYVQENRANINKQNQDKKFSEISKMMGDTWRNLTETERTPYALKAQEDKKRYEMEMKNYVPPVPSSSESSDSDSSSSEEVKKPPRKKAKRDPNAPKRAPNPYMIFQNAPDGRPKFRMLYPDLKMHEIAKKMSEKWKTMTDEEKKPYVDQSSKDKERYQREMAAYTQQKVDKD